MDEEKLERIENFLYNKGQSIDTIPRARFTQLLKIDEAIQKKIQVLSAAKRSIKSSNISISNISDDSNISRKTFYNNSLLKDYVESYAVFNEENTIPSSEYDRIVNKLNLTNNQLNGLLIRDIETENLKHQVSGLVKEIKSYQQRNLHLERLLEEKTSEILKLKQRLAKQENKVLGFSKRS